MASWFENQEFWESFRPIMFNPRRIEQAAGEIESVVKLLEIAPGSHVLDMCSGIGRHSIELARRGFKVTGVDRTPSYLERARRRAEKEGLAIEFVEADMREFRRPAAFDGAISLFTSFGYFEDPNEDVKAARNICDSLRPGARLAMDMNSKEILARKFRERDWEAGPEGTLFLQEHRLRSGWDWIENHWIVIRGSERYETTFGVRLYSGTELSQLLKAAGFSGVTLYGSLEGAPYDQNAERLIALAQK